MSETVSPDGRISIPDEIQQRMGIEPGSELEFDVDGTGRVYLRKVAAASARGRFESLVGTATAGLTTDEIMTMTRGDD